MWENSGKNTAIVVIFSVCTCMAGNVKKGKQMSIHMNKKTKNHILVSVLCVLCFLVFPLLLLNFCGEFSDEFGMSDFLVLIFWPAAGVGISAFYAIVVKNKRIWLLVPLITVVCLILVNLIMPELSFVLSFLCLIFEAAGYGMIYFWAKLEE